MCRRSIAKYYSMIFSRKQNELLSSKHNSSTVAAILVHRNNVRDSRSRGTQQVSHLSRDNLSFIVRQFIIYRSIIYHLSRDVSILFRNKIEFKNWLWATVLRATVLQ